MDYLKKNHFFKIVELVFKGMFFCCLLLLLKGYKTFS